MRLRKTTLAETNISVSARYVLTLTLAVSSLACSKQMSLTQASKDKENTTDLNLTADFKSRIFLKNTDFDLSKNTKKLSKNEVVGKITYGFELNDYNEDSSSSPEEEEETPPPPQGDCTEPVVETQVKGRKGQIQFNATGKLENCKLTHADGTTTISIVMKYMFVRECETNDYSAFDNKNSDEIRKLSKELAALERCSAPILKDGWVGETTETGEFVSTKGDNNVKTFSQSRQAKLSPQDDLCVAKKDGEHLVWEDCVSLAQTTETASGGEFSYHNVETTRFQRKNLIDSDNPAHRSFGGGTIEFNIANWQGTAQYSAFDKPGQFVVRNGQEEVSGQLMSNTATEYDEVSDVSEDETKIGLRLKALDRTSELKARLMRSFDQLGWLNPIQ